MFDIPQCRRSFVGVPLEPPIYLLGLLLLLGGIGLWLWLRQKRRRQLWQLGIGTVLLILVTAFAEPGLMLGVSQDSGSTADAIVILGRGETLKGNRVTLAAQLWQQQRGPIIFNSGVYDSPRFQQQLLTTGLPNSALDGENCSLTTPENARFSAAILQARGARKIILVTDAPHSWRSRLEYEHQGFEVISAPISLPQTFTGLDRAFLMAREYFFLLTTSIGHRLGDSAPDPSLTQLLQRARTYGQQQPPRR
jgi:uncharacterized SAM-binding protein YcdF (DUF218 family)